MIRIGPAGGLPTSSIRALCDPGSQVNLITESCVQRFGLKRDRKSIDIDGIGEGQLTRSHGSVNLIVRHRISDQHQLPALFHVVKRLATELPNRSFQNPFKNIPSNQLADPSFCRPSHVEILLGAGFWAGIIECDIKHIKMRNCHFTAQRTTLGWVIIGSMATSELPAKSCHLAEASNNELDRLLQRLWQQDESIEVSHLTPEEVMAENIFQTTSSRSPDGRYIVQLPFRAQEVSIGGNRPMAVKRYLQLEQKLANNPALSQQYREIISDYFTLGHLVRATDAINLATDSHYYIPYHIINKKKLRVVFDASNKAPSGSSLNDWQLPGPKLQNDLSDTLLRFRLHRYAVTADIVKMFRQVMADPSHWRYQRIVWRDTPNDAIEDYCLTVVVWGMTSANFNAVRSLQQCAMDVTNEFPIGAKAILSDFYVDDFLSSASDTIGIKTIYDQVSTILRKGGFQLAKWATNHPGLMKEIGQEDQLDVSHDIPLEAGVLGLSWFPQQDVFRIKVNITEQSTVPTKRELVSTVAKIYDPSGIIAPVLIRGRMMIQEVWRCHVNWDKRIPSNLSPAWRQLMDDISEIHSIEVPRWMGATDKAIHELHIFGDASEKAFGAVAYLRTEDTNGEVRCCLITSKSKVSPIKQVTIPRLELEAAKMAARLGTHLMKVCELPNSTVHYWSDSTITLFWIRRDTATLKPFIRNRVTVIQQITDQSSWRHVPGDSNPADMLSRGMSTKDLKHSKCWWEGPPWLKQSKDHWPSNVMPPLSPEEIEVEKRDSISAHVGLAKTRSAKYYIGVYLDNRTVQPIIERRSTLSSALRVTAIVRRFQRAVMDRIEVIRKRQANQVSRPMTTIAKKPYQPTHTKRVKRKYKAKNTTPKQTKDISPVMPVSVAESQAALCYWIKWAQATYFVRDIDACKKGVNLPDGSQVTSLNPFLDDEGILRMGGRLKQSSLPVQAKNPIIIPTESALAALLRREAHINYHHAGVQLTTTILRRKYWMPRMRQALKSDIFKCVKCFRQRQDTIQQQMGDLPRVRVNKATPFEYTGIDFAGPIIIKKHRGKQPATRGAVARDDITTKAWIVVFVCMVTRAIHLDLIQGLTVEDFLPALSRFTARRGGCREMWSDNGSTFIGTDNELRRVIKEWQGGNLTSELTKKGITWRFITPAAPHQGGIWEAGVKAVKHHLKRIAGQNKLSGDQLYTILVEIEGCLNSRPLYPLTDDPNDLEPLTPAHFIMGKAVHHPPLADNLREVLDGRLTAWGLQQKIVQQFWAQWHDEYLASLQQRRKWQFRLPNLKLGDMVVIKNENLPPATWALGRVTVIHLGQDHLVRSATIRTASNEANKPTFLERPVHKLCLLPFCRASQEAK